ncbi:MAG TPA: hypothetical protein VF933_19755 [Streptosporangiaceae bacterium]
MLARLAETGTYIDDPDDAAALTEQAVAVAEESDDPAALAAALRARHLACSGPEGAGERDALAGRLLGIGERLAGPHTQLLARSWRVDVGFARGRLAAVAGELENLRWCVQQVGGPAGWHLLRYQAALAQARGDFDIARQHADAAFDTIAPLHHPAAFPIRMALLVSIDHHRGADPNAEHVQACRQTGRV